MTEKTAGKGDGTAHISFGAALGLVNDEVGRTLSKSPSIIREYTSHLNKSRGKFIRAISLLTCAMDADGMVHPDAVKCAAAVEILHLATLVHDDVIDDADIRRDIPTLQKKYGKKTAVICGDYLFCAAIGIMSSVRNRQDYVDIDLPDYMTRICFGELSQHINSGNLNLSVYRYLKIISGKTAALFEACFHAGAVLSGCGARETGMYRRLGRYLGMLFQLVDDCMDFEATEAVAGKPVQSDFEQNVVTLPLIYALDKLAGFKEKAAGRGISRRQLNEAVLSSGGINFTRMVAKKYYSKYMKVLNELDIPDCKREGLQSILYRAYRVF